MSTQSLTCSCCGGFAGKFEQWHNRDRGYGICADCIAWLRAPREGKPPRCDEAEIARLYGVEGVHFGKPALRFVCGDGARFATLSEARMHANRVHERTGAIIAIEEA